MWKLLKEQYEQSNEPRIFELEHAINNITQEQSSVNEYFTQLKSLWNELHQFSPLPVCTCGLCDKFTCKVLKNIADREDKCLTMMFLVGLSDNSLPIRGNILLMMPFPSLNEIYSLIIQEEQQRAFTRNPSFRRKNIAMLATNQREANVVVVQRKIFNHNGQKEYADS